MSQVDQGRVVLEALQSRQSSPRLSEERPPRELVEQILQAGVSAPNHFKTEPWRFIVLTGGARSEFGKVLATRFASTLDDPDSPECAQSIEKERRKPLRAPILLVVAVVPSQIGKVVEVEEIAAGAAAVQNILLAAEAVGLGAMWRTGWPAYDAGVKAYLGIPEHGHLLAFVYLGYSDPLPRSERTRDYRDHTEWRGWGDD